MDGCGEVVRAKAIGPSRRGEKSPRPEQLLRGGGPHPPPRLATARHAASAAPPLRHEPQDDGRVKTSPEGRRTTSLGEEGRGTTHFAFHGVLSAGRKRFGEGFASVFYIGNKKELPGGQGQNTTGKKEAMQCRGCALASPHV